jgi:uncharacterized protein (TIGR02145 family)
MKKMCVSNEAIIHNVEFKQGLKNSMFALIILFFGFFFTLRLNAQEIKLSKEDKQTKDILHSRLQTTVQYNDVIKIKFAGTSKEYSTKIAELEKYVVSNLLPLSFVGQIAQQSIFVGQYPLLIREIYYLDNRPFGTIKDNVMYNVELNNNYILNTIYDFQTINGPALVIEVKNKSAEEYYHGLILLDDFKKLMNKIENKEIGVFIDERDGAYYKWSKIGNQIWMAENLKYQTSEIGEKERYKTNNEIYYNYFQAVSACPKGWHLPSDAEWKTLEKYVGVSDEWLDYLGRDFSRGDGKGEKNIIDMLTMDESLGFLAKYSGYYNQNNYQIFEVGKQAFFWTRTKLDEVNAIVRVIGTDFEGGVVRDKLGIHNYFSCRCVKDLDINEIAENNQIIKDLLQKEANGEMTSDDYYNRSVEFLIIGEESRSFNDIESALKLDNSNLEYKLFKAQFLYLYQFNKEANQVRSLLNEYLTSIKNNDFAYYLAFKAELYDFKYDQLQATSDKLRRQKALDYLENAIRLDPKNPYYLELKAKLFISDSAYDKAIKAIGIWLSLDPKNGEAHYLLGISTLNNFDTQNKVKKISAPEWCGMISGCYKVTAVQLKEVCSHFTKAINYGYAVNPDYYSLCGELKAAEILEQHQPIIHVGPRGGRYTISSSGNKVYIPRQ